MSVNVAPPNWGSRTSEAQGSGIIHGVEDARPGGTAVVRSTGLNLVWCGLISCLVPVAWLSVALFSLDWAWFWSTTIAAGLLALAILRRRVIVENDRVVVQGAFWRREHLIRDIERVDLVEYDGFWAWNESFLDDLFNPFGYLSSPLLTLRAADDPDESEHELRALAGTTRGAGRRADRLLRAIVGRGGHPLGDGGYRVIEP